MEPKPDALMFRTTVQGAPEWRICPAEQVEFFRWMGWFLLASEKEIRQAMRDHDIEQTRRDDERGLGR